MNCTKPLKISHLSSNFSTNVESQFSFNFRAKHQIKKSNVIHGVKNSNKIIVLGNKNILEQGSHNELIDNDNFYRDLAQSNYGVYD